MADRIKTAADLAQSMAKVYAKALMNPGKAFNEGLAATQEIVKTLTGSSEIAPDRGDKRFRDPVWQTNPSYRIMMQSYLAWTRASENWIDSLDIDEGDRLRVKLLSNLVSDTLAPSNFLLGNPAAVKQTIDDGGKNLLTGMQHLIKDVIENGGLPSMVDKSKFKVGENLALSQGAVVYSEPHLELIQYKPTTDKVYKRPIFIVPPQINKFYVWDLAPERSIVEYLVSHGHQVFIVSWYNPQESEAHWDLESYIDALDRATEVACEISKSPDLNLIGACSGGITTALLLASWSARGIKRANSMSMLVAVLDVSGAKHTSMGLFANLETLELAKIFSHSKGVLAGKDLERAFAWLRPNDLIWSYWVNNYLMGKEPPAFDILFWNSDTTNLPADLHRDLMNLLEQGGFRDDDDLVIGKHKISLKKVTCDTFILGGDTDHITPWDGCYLTRNLLGGNTTFVLSQSGHIQSLINPPGNPKARYKTNDSDHKTAAEFLAGADEHAGSWWPMWLTWLSERGGQQVAPAKSLGSAKHKPIGDAPGTYVHVAA